MEKLNLDASTIIYVRDFFGNTSRGNKREVFRESKNANLGFNRKKGTIALIATPKFRERKEELESFCYSHLYFLCFNFDVVATGGTCKQLLEFVNRPFKNLTVENQEQIISDWESVHSKKLAITSDANLKEWRETILNGLVKDKDRPECGVKGMIDVICRIVDKKIDAVIHLTDWQDKNAKQDSAVLCREANVHNIPIATNIDTAEAFIKQWQHELQSREYNLKKSGDAAEKEKKKAISLEEVFGDYENSKEAKILAMISHNGKKTAMDTFTVEHYEQILKNKYILATEATGERLLRIMKALTGKDYSDKICCCKPGPKGGDLQIAQAVITGVCKNIIFFQDPEISQPHDSDVRLFEQAVTTPGVHARLATNPASAELLISWLVDSA